MVPRAVLWAITLSILKSCANSNGAGQPGGEADQAAPPTAWVVPRLCSYLTDLAQVRPMRCHTADGVDGLVADEGIVIRALSALQVIPEQPEARYSPATSRAGRRRHAGRDGLDAPGPACARAVWRSPPIPRLNPALGGCCRMEFHLWVGHEAPQAGQGAVLTMAKLRQLGTGEDERILYRQGELCHRSHNGLDVLGERRIAMVQQARCAGIQLSGRRGKAAGSTVVLVSIFAIAGG